MQLQKLLSLHIYENDEHKVIPTEVGSDVVDEVLEGNSSILVCSDINAELVLYLKMNSAKSQLGKLGLTKRNDLAKLSLLPKGKTHLENFHFEMYEKRPFESSKTRFTFCQ